MTSACCSWPAPAAVGVDPQLEALRGRAQEVLDSWPQLRPHLPQECYHPRLFGVCDDERWAAEQDLRDAHEHAAMLVTWICGSSYKKRSAALGRFRRPRSRISKSGVSSEKRVELTSV